MRSHSSLVSSLLALLWVGSLSTVLACTRTPPEPIASSQPATDGALEIKKATVASMTSGSASGGKVESTSAPVAIDPLGHDRCVRATTAEGPPIEKPASASSCPVDPGAMTMKTARVSFPEASPATSIDVELASSPDETARGLMYRRTMPADHGMLFDLKSRKVQTFWMHNTCIPLDMLFVDEDGLVVGILEQVPVLNDDARTVGCPSRYVLETNAGYARKHGIKAGQKIKLPDH